MSEGLVRYTRELDSLERARLAEGDAPLKDIEEPVLRGGHPISVALVHDLMDLVMENAELGVWTTREESDRWLAPRLHAALRLTRAEAADKGTWHWLALQYGDYVTYRWKGEAGIARDRWFGPIHKQALARLWWGAELFRDGPDYRPVEFFFKRQDLPNSYLHRPLVRCRPLALGMLDQLRVVGGEDVPKATDINDLARVLNLTTAGVPPEAETGFVRDDAAAYLEWLESPSWPEDDWADLPRGPETGARSQGTQEAGLAIAERGWEVAGGVAQAIGARSARRTG